MADDKRSAVRGGGRYEKDTITGEQNLRAISPLETMKATLKKMTRVGRMAALCLALAVVLAATVGVASPATAAKAKDAVFELGKKNAVKAVSSMVGSLADPILKLDNNGTGPAMDLQVELGKVPLTVNSTAGTATDLSADELDGKDSTAFFSGKTYLVRDQRTGLGGGHPESRRVHCDEGAMIRLHDSLYSGNGYKVRLLLVPLLVG